MIGEESMGIGLLTFGEVDRKEIDFLPAELEEAFGLAARWGPALVVPSDAFHRSRGQYLAAALLEALSGVPPGEFLRILGIADIDLFAPGLNFVFGQALMGGRDCVISLVRLRPLFYGLPPDELLFRERTVKEAVHELGHTFSLEHCSDPACVMRFSNSLSDTDRKSRRFCPRCRSLLERGLGRLCGP